MQSRSELFFIANIKQAFELFGAMEGEDFSAARKRIESIGETSYDAGRFVTEGKRQSVVRYAIRKAFGVFVGLCFDAGKSLAFLLGFDNTGNFTVNVEAIICLLYTSPSPRD